MLVWRRIFALGMCAAPATLMTDRAVADIVSIVAAKDNTLYQDETGSLSNGSGQGCFAGTTAMGLKRRAVMQFDLADVLAGATIVSVTLNLHMSMTSTGATDVSLHRLLADWGEGASIASGNGGAGATASTGDATWIHTFHNTAQWTTAGGDFAVLASATTSVDDVGDYAWTSAAMLADVQLWLSDPASNFGWLLRGDEAGTNTTKRFDTREIATPSFRPTLVIEYAPIPAPGGLAVLMCASVLRASRQRRERSPC